MTATADHLRTANLGDGWYVVDQFRQPVTGRYSYEAKAEIRLDKIRRRAGARRRPCMCCGQRFLSEGPHNRLCTTCRRVDLSPLAP